MTALKLDEARINAAAVDRFDEVYPRLVDYQGRPHVGVGGPQPRRRTPAIDAAFACSTVRAGGAISTATQAVETSSPWSNILGQTSRERAVEFLADSSRRSERAAA